MGRRIKYLFLILSLFFFIVSLSCTNKKGSVYEVRGHFLIHNQLKIDLKDDIETILSQFNDDYETENIPETIGYHLKNYPVSIFYNIEKKIVDELVFIFYEEGKEDIFIDNLKISGLNISKNTSFEEMKTILNKKNMKFKLKEYSSYYKIRTTNFSIRYLKNNLKTPDVINILIK